MTPETIFTTAEESPQPSMDRSRQALLAYPQPTFLQRLISRVAGQPLATMPKQTLWDIPMMSERGMLNPWNEDVAADQYTGHVYTATRCIARRTAAALKSMYLELADTIDETTESITNHPAIKAIFNPNPFMEGSTLIELTSTWLDLQGNAYWLILRDAGYRVIGYFPLLPHMTRVVLSRDPGQLIKGFNFYPSGFSKPPIGFELQDVIRFVQPHPKQFVYGFSTLQAAVWEVNSFDTTRRHRERFFKNQARPDYVVGAKVAPGDLGTAQLEELWARILEHHQGEKGVGLPLLVPGEDVRVAVLGWSPIEMQWMEGRKWDKASIYEVFGVNRYVVGEFDQSVGSRAEADTAEVQFSRGTLVPRCDLITAAVQNQLVVREGLLETDDSDRWTLELKYHDPTPPDREFEHKRLLDGLAGGAVTIDEYRQLDLKLPPYERGETPGSVLMTSMTEVPLDDAVAQTAGSDSPSEIGPGPDSPQRLAPTTRMALRSAPHLSSLPSTRTAEERLAYWKRAAPVLDAHERRTRKVAAVAFRKQWQRLSPGFESALKKQLARTETWGKRKIRTVLGREVRSGILEDGWGSDDKELQSMFASFLPSITMTYSYAGKQATKPFDVDFKVANPLSVRWLRGHTLELAGNINSTTRKALGRQIALGIENNESVQQIMDRLQTQYRSFEDERALRIARTETTTAMGKGTLDGWKHPELAGIVEEKQWINSGDDRVRDEHSNDDGVGGEIVSLDAKFSNGMEFPGDPAGGLNEIVNCRCIMAPIVKGQAEE